MDKFLKEEINNHIERLDNKSSKRFKKVINELFMMKTDQLADNIGSVEKDGNNEIASENWSWLLDTIASSIVRDEEAWHEYFKKTNLKILTYKYFTKRDLVKLENLESFIKVNIKPYFTALQNYVDVSDFKNKFFKLPSDIAFCLVRFCASLDEGLKEKIQITKKELRLNIVAMRDLRMKVADTISQISKGYKNLLDFNEIVELYDNGLLSEDNFINRGITEFVSKLISNENAKEKLLDIVSNAVLRNINKNIQTFPSYMNHANDIKMEVDTNYFTSDGEQVGKKFENYIELTTGGDFDGYVFDKDSVFKEPQRILNPVISTPGMMGDTSGVEGGTAADGSVSGGAGMGNIPGGLDGELPGDDFAAPGSEGEIPGIEDDGTPMPDDEDGLPKDFGAVEDNDPEEIEK